MTRPYDATHGQVLEFEKQLFATGLTLEQMVELSRDKTLMTAWVDSLTPIMEAAANSDSTRIQDVFSRDLGLVFGLRGHNVDTLSELVELSASELGNLRGIGSTRMKLIQDTLAERGLKLSTHRADDPDRVIAKRNGGVYRAFRRDQLDDLNIQTFFELPHTESLVKNGSHNLTIGELRKMSLKDLYEYFPTGTALKIHSWITENAA